MKKNKKQNKNKKKTGLVMIKNKNVDSVDQRSNCTFYTVHNASCVFISKEKVNPTEKIKPRTFQFRSGIDSFRVHENLKPVRIF